MTMAFVAGCFTGVFIGSILTLFIIALVTVGSRADEHMGYE